MEISRLARHELPFPRRLSVVERPQGARTTGTAPQTVMAPRQPAGARDSGSAPIPPPHSGRNPLLVRVPVVSLRSTTG